MGIKRTFSDGNEEDVVQENIFVHSVYCLLDGLDGRSVVGPLFQSETMSSYWLAEHNPIVYRG